jgi:hypothetical protein
LICDHQCTPDRNDNRRDGDEDDVGIRRIAAITPERRGAAARPLSEPCKAASDVPLPMVVMFMVVVTLP